MVGTMAPKRLALLLGSLMMGGCAALLNSGRPRYSGRVVQPAWHDPNLKVEQTPLIDDGLVFAVARPYADRDYPRVYAFDLKTGRFLWAAEFAAREILLAVGSRLFVKDIGGRIYSLDTKTGRECAGADAVTFSRAVLTDGVLYSTGGNIVEARPADALPIRAAYGNDRIPPLWLAFLPSLPRTSLAVGLPNVYAYGYIRWELHGKPALNVLHAFNARTGDLRWKWEVPGKGDTFMLYGVTGDTEAAYLWIHDLTENTFGKGVLIALDASTGEEKWRQTVSTWVPFWDAPVLMDPHVVVVPDYPPGKDGAADSAGILYHAFDRAIGQKAWESQTAWKYQNPVPFKDHLYVSDKKIHQLLDENNNFSPDSWITSVDLRSGKEVWRSQTVELGVFTQPAAGEGMVVVGSQPFTRPSPTRSGKMEAGGLWAWRMPE